MNRHGNLLAALVIGLLAALALGAATNLVVDGGTWLVEGNQAEAHLGQTVTRAGDVNGDGYGDLLIGGRFDFGEGGTGVAYAYYGSAQGLGTAPDWTAPNDQPNQYVFLSLAGAGDVNGDGYDDVVVGSSHYTADQLEEGRAYIYYGSASGLSPTPGWVVDGNQRILYYGRAVAGVGDVNGDGYDDILIGAPYKRDPDTGDVIGQVLLYLGSPSGPGTTADWTVEGSGGWSDFGGHLNAAGDVNGDGFDDFLVSDSFFSNQYDAEGRAFLFYGSANGPASAAGWTADGGQAHANFGSSLAPAGDINGDGYGDVIIGAPSYSANTGIDGRAFIYYGSAGGLSQTAGWTADGDTFGEYFSNAVASAGDVNGDGYDDVIIGGYGYSGEELSEGRAFVYLGSPGGLASAPAWMAEGDQAQANFGGSVGSTGDSNGDGRSEWAVGAPQYDRGETNEGIALVFDDLAGALPTPPPTTPAPTPTEITYLLHVSDLDGVAESTRSTWIAQVTIEIRNVDGSLVDQVAVSGAWSTGETAQCTTGVYGVCAVILRDLPKKLHDVTFTVSDVQRTRGTYDPSANTDPDGDSDGTQITVSR